MIENDITIIGAGVIGLAVSYILSGSGKSIVVIDKNSSFGQEASSRNSEVIHAGLYYEPGSLKAETCIKGREMLYELCSKYNINYRKLGKLVIASSDDEIKEIESIYNNALSSGVKNLSFLEKEDINKLEPQVHVKKAFYSPDSGIIDSHGLMNFFYHKSKQSEITFSFSTEVVGVEKCNSGYKITVRESGGDLFSFNSSIVINCAGLYSDRIAQMVGIDIDKYAYRIHYCKGQYFRIRNPKSYSVKHLVYPPATRVSLGIHITPDLGGGLRLGPDAKYISSLDYTVNDDDRCEFYNAVKTFLPTLSEDDLIPDTAGIRPKLQQETEGFRDFIIQHEQKKWLAGFVNLIGIESPGLTASLAIAEMVKGIVKEL